MNIRESCILYLIAAMVVLGTAASAAVVTVSPHQVNPGETVTVAVNGLTDESSIKMSWEVFIDKPGSTFLWTVDGLAFPINLQDASFKVTNQNTGTNTVTLENEVPNYETRSLTLSGNSVNGIWTAYHGNDFINGSWPVIRNEGTVVSGKTYVLSLVEWEGIKRANPDIPEQQNGGPDNFVIPLSFSGFDRGQVKFTIQVDGIDVVTETVTVGSPDIRTGTISVSSSPSAALVYVDGVYYGVTPQKISGIPTGLRTISVTKEGYADYTAQVQVTTTGTKIIRATLNPMTASIKVNSVPRSASVYLDNILQGITPMVITGVAPGTHTLKLTKDGYQDYITTVTTHDGETVKFNMIRMQRNTAAKGQSTVEAGRVREQPVTRFDFSTSMERFSGRYTR